MPTTIIIIDGVYYARINSLTNSTYSVIYNPFTFSDLNGYWAEDMINNMEARTACSIYGCAECISLYSKQHCGLSEG